MTSVTTCAACSMPHHASHATHHKPNHMVHQQMLICMHLYLVQALLQAVDGVPDKAAWVQLRSSAAQHNHAPVIPLMCKNSGKQGSEEHDRGPCSSSPNPKTYPSTLTIIQSNFTRRYQFNFLSYTLRSIAHNGLRKLSGQGEPQAIEYMGL